MVYLSHDYSIKTLLNIKDKNILFDDAFVSDKSIKGITSKVFHAKLTYSPHSCTCCGGHGNSIINMALKLP